MIRLLKEIAKLSSLGIFVKINFYDTRKFKQFGKQVKMLIAYTAISEGRSRYVIAADMFIKSLITNAQFMDYFRFKFYKKSVAEANKYLTEGRYEKMYPLFSTKQNRRIMREKSEFNKVFKDHVKRDWIHINPDSIAGKIEEFINKHPVFIGKCENLRAGQGVQLVDSTKFSSTEALLIYLKRYQLFQIEERVFNHEVLAPFSERSLNTIRIITVRHPEGVKIICAYLKFGVGDAIADYAAGAGYECPIDIETGRICKGVTDNGALKGRFVKQHPAGFEVIGMKIPYWEELVKMICEAAVLLDNIVFIPWDVAVSPDGPLIVEGNSNCGCGFQITTEIPVYHDVKKAWKYAKVLLKNKG